MTSGKCKLKWEITKRLSEWTRFGKLTAPTAGEYIELQEFLLIAWGNAKRTAALEDSVAASYKTKHTLTIHPRIALFGVYLELKTYAHTKGGKWVFLWLYGFIYNSQNLGTTQMAFSK